MQIEEFQGSVHPVNNGMLVDESGQLMHDLVDQILRVVEIVHNMTARDLLMSLVHTVMESLYTVDIENFVVSDFSDGSFFHVF